MAIQKIEVGSEHKAIADQLHISLPEMLEIAKRCIRSNKDNGGVFGYPASLLLLSIVDCIGSYVRDGSVENHFLILRDEHYFGVVLEDEEIKRLYKLYRNRLSHNGVLGFNTVVFVGQQPSHPYLIFGRISSGNGDKPILTLNLNSLWQVASNAVEQFLSEDLEHIVQTSKVYSDMVKDIQREH